MRCVMDKFNALDLAIRIIKEGVGHRQYAYSFVIDGQKCSANEFVGHPKVVMALSLLILDKDFWYSTRKSNSKYFVCMFRVPNPHHIYETSDPNLGIAMTSAFVEVLECWRDKEKSG